MTRCPTILTDRLTMRPFVEADLDSYARIMMSEPVRTSLRMPDDFDEYGAWQQMASFAGQWELRGTGQWALEERSSGRLVGRAGTHWPHRFDWPGVEVGWALDPAVWGRGFATEAGRATVGWAFDTLDVEELCSMIHVENPRSSSVARRLGFEAVETRVFAWFAGMEHTRWVLPRAVWQRVASAPR